MMSLTVEELTQERDQLIAELKAAQSVVDHAIVAYNKVLEKISKLQDRVHLEAPTPIAREWNCFDTHEVEIGDLFFDHARDLASLPVSE